MTVRCSVSDIWRTWRIKSLERRQWRMRRRLVAINRRIDRIQRRLDERTERIERDLARVEKLSPSQRRWLMRWLELKWFA